MKEMIHILKECSKAVRIGISGHIRPDGDCVGSCLALWQYLKKAMPKAQIKVFLQKPADIFKDLKGFDQIDSVFEEEEVFDVFFALDCNQSRLGDAEKYFVQAKKKINIDHHISNQDGCGDVNFVRPEVGSTIPCWMKNWRKQSISVLFMIQVYFNIPIPLRKQWKWVQS